MQLFTDQGYVVGHGCNKVDLERYIKTILGVRDAPQGRVLGPRQDREAAAHEKKRETRGREYAKKEEKREQEKKDRQEDWKEYRRLDGGFGGKGRDRWREGSKQKAEKKAEKEAQSGSWEGWIKMRNRSGVDDGW